MKALVSIEGFDLPEPSEYRSKTATVVNKARNVEAVMIGSVVRPDMAKVTLTWKWLSAQQWAEVLSQFKGFDRFSRQVTFFLQDTATWETRKMYVSDRDASMFRRDPVTGDVLGYLGCTLSLTEV